MGIYSEHSEYTKAQNTLCESHLRKQKKGKAITRLPQRQLVLHGKWKMAQISGCTDILQKRKCAVHKTAVQRMPQLLPQTMELVSFIIPVHNSILN